MTSPLKTHGGKGPIANWIVGLMPPRCKNPNDPASDDSGYLHYVEPYFGGGSVMLANDPEGISEVANDTNSSLTNFWCVLQSKFGEFKRFVSVVPFSKFEHIWAGDMMLCEPNAKNLWHALGFFIRCRQSLAGRMDTFAPITRNRTRRGMNEQVSAWLSAIDGLPEVHNRMKRVLVLNKEALDVIREQDGKRTLFYLDPPYMAATRSTTGEYGDHEMTNEQHEELLDLLTQIDGRFLLSGYRSKMYDRFAKANGWNRHEKKVKNHAAGGKTKRTMTECLYCNY